MKLTEIWTINDNGIMSMVTLYTLPKLEAITCFYEQTIRHNFNTWDYKYDPAKFKKLSSGEYCFDFGENTVFYTKEEKS